MTPICCPIPSQACAAGTGGTDAREHMKAENLVWILFFLMLKSMLILSLFSI